MPDRKTKEKQLWAWLSRAQPLFHLLHVERIENTAGKGTPDVHGCIEGRSFTIELKAVARTRLIDCELRPEQIWWAIRRNYVGGKDHWCLIQVGSGAAAKRYLIPGAFVVELKVPRVESYLNFLSVRVITHAEDVFDTIRKGI